jgi:hypothetical protein
MHKAQVRLEAGESRIEIEIGIEIDSVQFCASVQLDTDFPGGTGTGAGGRRPSGFPQKAR